MCSENFNEKKIKVPWEILINVKESTSNFKI